MDTQRLAPQVLLALGCFGLGVWFGQAPDGREDPAAVDGGVAKADEGTDAPSDPLNGLLAEEAALRAEIKSRLGPAPQWPEAPARELTADYFNEIVVGDLAAVLGVEAAMNDCVQFPCMASFALPLSDREEALYLDAVEVRNGLYQEWGKDRVAWASEWGAHFDSEGQGWFLVTVAIKPEGTSEDFEQRLAARAVLQTLGLRRMFGLVE